MSRRAFWLSTLSLVALAIRLVPSHAAPAPKLSLAGYAADDGVISILHEGDTVDPYFTLQALLLAHDNGLDISPHAEKWAGWMLQRQKPDATFDRFCRIGPVWAPCKTADADDALLAMWMRFLDTMPTRMKSDPSWRKSYQASAAALLRLRDSRGIYLVSPVYQHGLFMDNLEVWSYKPARRIGRKTHSAGKLAEAIYAVFWDAKDQRFLVSTQPEQKHVAHAFYPEHVAQIFPLMVDFPLLPIDRSIYYQRWMQQHRGSWLKQVQTDFAWGLVAVIAIQQRDVGSARCWLRETDKYRHTAHWTVTDEVARQVLNHKKLRAAASRAACD